MSDTNALIDRLIRIKDGLTHRADRDAINEACAAFTDGSFYKESDIDAMQDKIAALDAERDRWKDAYRAVSNDLNLVVPDLDKAKAQVAALTKERDAARAVAFAEAAEIVARISERDGGYAQAAFYEAERAILARAAEVNAEPAMTGVRVKPLVWKGMGGGFWRAPAPLFGFIRVEHYSDDYQVVWSVPGFCDTFTPGRFVTEEAAKAAAQADYEARILAALEKPE